MSVNVAMTCDIMVAKVVFLTATSVLDCFYHFTFWLGSCPWKEVH